MESRKVTKTIACLLPEERKLFRKFLQAEYHTADMAALVLFDFMVKNHFDLPEALRKPSRFTLERAHKKVFPKETFSERKISHKCSDLGLLAEDFLAQEELKKQNYEKKKLLTQAYIRRNKYELAKAHLKKAKTVLDKHPNRDASYYLDKTKLLLGQYFSVNSKKFKLKESEAEFDKLLGSMNNLIALLQLQVGIEAKSRSGIFSKAYPEIVNISVANAKRLQSEQNPVIRLYLLAYQLLETSKLETYWELEQNFAKQEASLGPNAQNMIATILLNYAFRTLDKGISRKETLDLAKRMVRQEYLIEGGFFPAPYFTNIVILSAEYGDTDWTQTFLEYGEKNLIETEKEKTLAKCWAYHYFSKKDFGKALIELQKVPTTRINDRLQVSALEIRCFFELDLLGKEIPMLDKIAAYRKLIARKKNLNPLIKEQNLKFLSVLTRLSNGLQLSSEEKQAIADEVRQAKRIVARSWLLQKINP